MDNYDDSQACAGSVPRPADDVALRPASAAESDTALGYEAADPSLQTLFWAEIAQGLVCGRDRR